MLDIILNQIAIWVPTGVKELNIRQNPLGIKYREPDGVIYKAASRPMYRYVKDYAVKGVKFSLILCTLSDNAKYVETQLDATAKQITKEYALKATTGAPLGNLEYTPFRFTPTVNVTTEES